MILAINKFSRKLVNKLLATKTDVEWDDESLDALLSLQTTSQDILAL